MLQKAAALFLACASMALCVSCGSTTSRYLYAALPTSDQIVVFREDPNSGILTQLASSPVTAGPSVHSLVVHPSSKFLYAANAGEGDVSLFTISSSGALTEVTRAVAGNQPTVLAMDPAGAYLYVANSGGQSISVFSIDPVHGTLSSVTQTSSGLTAPLGITPINIQVSPSGGFLYVTGAGQPAGYIEIFSLSQGVLTPLSPPRSPTRVRILTGWRFRPMAVIFTPPTTSITPFLSSRSARGLSASSPTPRSACHRYLRRRSPF